MLYLAYTFVCILSYFVTYKLIPFIKPFNLKANQFGMDINKRGTEAGEKKIPESMGIVPTVIFIMIGAQEPY